MTVFIGDPRWERRARVADILVDSAPELARAELSCARMFARHPGLALMVVVLPGDRMLVGDRCARQAILRLPRYRPDVGARELVEIAAAAIYSWVTAGVGGTPQDAPPQAGLERARPG